MEKQGLAEDGSLVQGSKEVMDEVTDDRSWQFIRISSSWKGLWLILL